MCLCRRISEGSRGSHSEARAGQRETTFLWRSKPTKTLKIRSTDVSLARRLPRRCAATAAQASMFAASCWWSRCARRPAGAHRASNPPRRTDDPQRHAADHRRAALSRCHGNYAAHRVPVVLSTSGRRCPGPGARAPAARRLGEFERSGVATAVRRGAAAPRRGPRVAGEQPANQTVRRTPQAGTPVAEGISGLSNRRAGICVPRQRQSEDPIAAAILDHLAAYPHASDTADGIAGFWLPPSLRDAPRKQVRRALDRLLADGVLVRIPAVGGQHRYAAPSPTSNDG